MDPEDTRWTTVPAEPQNLQARRSRQRMYELAREISTLKPANPRGAQVVQDHAAQRCTEAELMPEPAELCRVNQ
jgi:hypothetical protein